MLFSVHLYFIKIVSNSWTNWHDALFFPDRWVIYSKHGGCGRWEWRLHPGQPLVFTAGSLLPQTLQKQVHTLVHFLSYCLLNAISVNCLVVMSQYFVEHYNDGISLLQNKAFSMGLLPFHFLQSCFHCTSLSRKRLGCSRYPTGWEGDMNTQVYEYNNSGSKRRRSFKWIP